MSAVFSQRFQREDSLLASLGASLCFANCCVDASRCFPLLPELGRYHQFKALIVSLHRHFDWLSNFCTVQGKGVVVNVCDLLAPEFDDDIATQQSGFLSRAPGTNTGDFDPADLTGIVRDCSQISAQVFARARGSIA